MRGVTVSPPRCAAALVFVLGTIAALSSCGNSNGEWQGADRAFVAAMIPHHHLGMTLVDEATLRSYDVRLRRLVFEMAGYHASELDTLERWSDAQGIAPLADFPGKVPAAEVSQLADLDTVAHDIWWLDLMIRHHRGAVELADDVLTDGGVTAVRSLASTVRRVQSAEIDQMEDLRRTLCSQISPPGAVQGCR